MNNSIQTILTGFKKFWRYGKSEASKDRQIWREHPLVVEKWLEHQLQTLERETREGTLNEVAKACRDYDEKYHAYPESEFEGWEVLNFIMDELSHQKESSE